MICRRPFRLYRITYPRASTVASSLTPIKKLSDFQLSRIKRKKTLSYVFASRLSYPRPGLLKTICGAKLAFYSEFSKFLTILGVCRSLSESV